MANTNLTIDMITRESLRVLHQGMTFIGNINRGYDDSFAKSGAKIGDTLRVRLPIEYTVRSGAALSAQDAIQKKVDVPVQTQKGVDFQFTSEEMALDIDEFSNRHIMPAMAVLAANIENDAISMYKDVYQQVSNVGSATTYANVLNTRKKLVDALVPMGADMNTFLLNTTANVDLVDALKGLFNDKGEISKQFMEGSVGRGQGFSFFETSHLNNHTSGSDNSGYLTNDATAQTGSTLTIDTGTGTLLKGDIFTIAGVNRVHPETKEDTGVLQQFVVTADTGASATSVSISPEIIATGAYQNVSNGAANNSALTKVGTASAAYGVSMAFNKDAFTFATADLDLPGGVDMASRQVFDGISMRIIRDYDINNDRFPSRLDVLYGYKTIRAQKAARLASN